MITQSVVSVIDYLKYGSIMWKCRLQIDPQLATLTVSDVRTEIFDLLTFMVLIKDKAQLCPIKSRVKHLSSCACHA